MVSVMTDNHIAWGHMEEENEEDMQIARINEFIGGSPNSRVRFSTNRTVVRYPSEKSLLLEETPTIINDEDDFGEQQGSDSDDEIEDETAIEESKPNHSDLVAPVSTNTTTPITTTTEISTNNSNGDMKKDDSIDTKSTPTTSSRSWFQRAQVVQRYTPRFTPPPPQVQADNGEDESDQEEDDEEEEEEDEEEEDGYDSVVEESGDEGGEDPIKKIAEETIVSRNQRLNEIREKEKSQVREQENQPSENERDKILQEVAQLKAQLQTEVEKVEQASKAASAAAAKAEEDSIALSSRVTSMRSLLAVLCGCGARIAGMLVATRLLDVTASHLQQPRTILSSSLLSAFRQFLPISPHIVIATGVSISQALLYYFRPSMKWWWLAGVNGTMGALMSVCTAAHGGARGTALGYALAAGCIIGLITSPRSLPS